MLNKITICSKNNAEQYYNLFTNDTEQDYNLFTNNTEQDNNLFTNNVEQDYNLFTNNTGCPKKHGNSVTNFISSLL